jgi:hypothetical protein
VRGLSDPHELIGAVLEGLFAGPNQTAILPPGGMEVPFIQDPPHAPDQGDASNAEAEDFREEDRKHGR